MQTILKGAYFRPDEAKAAVLALSVGERLWLLSEPTNPHDPNAIKVLCEITGLEETIDEFIGYVPRDHCLEVYSIAWNNGCEVQDLYCYVSALNGFQPHLVISPSELEEVVPDEPVSPPQQQFGFDELSDELPDE